MESAKLQFGNGQTRYIYDSMYQNAWEIKTFLKTIVIDNKSYSRKKILQIHTSEFSQEWFDTFKGNQFLSLKRISLWLIFGTIVYTFIITDHLKTDWGGLFLVLVALYWFFFLSWQMHYYKVSQTYFVVNNHNLIWINKAYRLADIHEIVFETRGNLPNCLRMITKDFRTALYPAGTLRDKTWLALKAKLETHNIPVRNECI
ncbi:hypothetical protein GXP67_34420 [Rhodocytophaga rosea]|uniref:Uncharacterized protein n=1 Tax=Rhodocytophaga rosea TaxID=2704465 RepID=A0A6C0GU97_9BACT|nr:hypothetical protein [Rhodocytophaga rosea]QHT71394.1 hypothetical protein GXP67_34420 [Rhodocytophaga rosea]